jgi:hypothetical protein
MFLNFFGVREDGEYSPKKNQPRPAWTYRSVRRNAARARQWPGRFRLRNMLRQMRERLTGVTVPA